MPGLASQKGHRAFVKSCAIEGNSISIIDGADDFLGCTRSEAEDEAEEEAEVEPKAKKSRWLHPDTCDVLKNRWKDEGGDEEEE